LFNIQSEKQRVRRLALLQIAKGRKVLGLYCVPYSLEGNRLDFINTPIIRLYSAVKIHDFYQLLIHNILYINIYLSFGKYQHQEFELKDESSKVGQFKLKKMPTILHGIEIPKSVPSSPINYHLHINFKCLIAKV
jgi:hypothetical protein